VIGADISGPAACIRRVKPEIAACNAGTLNYLKLRDDGRWAWPPMVFDNPVEKVQAFLDVMDETGTRPEFECFDVGIVRSVAMYRRRDVTPTRNHAEYNFVMGVASGMPVDADLLQLLLRWIEPGSPWQTTLIGRAEIWPLHQRTAELGGMLRSGPRRYLLPARWQPRGRQWRADRGARRLRAPRRARARQPGRGQGHAGPDCRLRRCSPDWRNGAIGAIERLGFLKRGPALFVPHFDDVQLAQAPRAVEAHRIAFARLEQGARQR
jgi:hypothetical protein